MKEEKLNKLIFDEFNKNDEKEFKDNKEIEDIIEDKYFKIKMIKDLIGDKENEKRN